MAGLSLSRLGVLVVVVGVLIGVVMRKNEGPCVDDEIRIFDDDDDINMTLNPCDCFSETYEQARAKFREAAEQALADLHALNIVNDEYTTDVAILPGNLPGLVIHSSGVHGVEGYAGSAIQVAWLTKYGKQLKEEKGGEKSSRPTIMFIHAVNPYGMAHYRRANEHNVDLNRNGLHPDEWKLALARDPNICHYDDLDESMLNPRRAPTWYDEYIRYWLQAIPVMLRKNGILDMKRSMVTGQYHNPKGIFFGGQSLQRSLSLLFKFLERKLPELGGNNGTVTWVDVHTGLGKPGDDTLLVFDQQSTVCSPDQLASLFPGSTVPGFDQAGDNVQAGYDLVMGIAGSFFMKLFSQQQQDPLLVTQEFGTIPAVLVGKALILENMAHHYLPADQALEWSKSQMRPAFYVRTPKWRSSILRNGLRVLKQSIARSSAVKK